MKAHSENGDKAPHILNISTRWRQAISFTPQPLSPRVKKKKKLQYLPQSWSRHHGDNKNPSLTGNQTPTAELIASCFTYFRCYFRCSENIREEKYSVCTPKI